MLRFRHQTLITLAGIVWLGMGGFLLSIGLRLLAAGTGAEQLFQHSYPWLNTLAPLAGGFENAALLLIVGGLLLGYFKGRMVLVKAAKRGVSHIRSFAEPVPIQGIYSLRTYILIAIMMGLGMLIKAVGMPLDIRGFIDVTVGAALIQGGVCYIRSGWTAS